MTRFAATAKAFIKTTKILLHYFSRDELKTYIDHAADEIKHAENKNGNIVKQQMTRSNKEYGETEKQIKQKLEERQ